MERPHIDYSKCMGCATCVSVCPMEVFGKEGDKVVVKRPEKCIQCKACEVSCPDSAIEVK